MASKFEGDAAFPLLNISGRARLTLMGTLAVFILTLGFLLALKAPVQAFVTKGTSCSAASCHGATNASASISVALNGTAGTAITAAAGTTFEVDWMFTNMLGDTAKNNGDDPELAVPTGWTVAPGTANSPALTGWSSTWNAADGVSTGWNTTYSTATEFPTSPVGYTINYNGTAWDSGNKHSAFDNGSATNPGDRDGVANKMGADARITVPAGTVPGTYTVMVLGIGHDASNTKSHVEQAITVTVPDLTAPTVNTFTMPATATSLTVNVTAFTASDIVGVTGYKMTESATAPLPGDAGWTATAPTTFTFSGAGTKTAYAWAKDAAGNVSTSRSATVTIALKTDQTITFNALATKTYGDADFAPGATASSGLTVSYASSNPAVATIVSNQIHIVGAGSSTITASQAGDATYNPAPNVQQTLTVDKANQTISFGALPTKTYGDSDFAPGGSASSGLTVSYASSNTSVATIVGGQIHIVGAGTSTITASQAGNTNYLAATNVQQTLTVIMANQTISFGALPTKTYGDADFAPGGSASSGLTVSYASSNTSVATIVGGQIHIVSAGTTTITASQAGNTNYNAASNVQQTLTVNTKTLSITAAAKSKTYGGLDPVLTYSSTGLVGTDTISGSLTRLAGENVGIYAINQGSLSAGSNYTISYTGASLNVTPAGLTITADAKSKVYGASEPVLTYVATGFVNGDTSAIMSGSLTRVAGTNVGIYAINQGSLSAGSNYSLTYVGANLTITKADATVTLGSLAQTYDGTAKAAIATTTPAGLTVGFTYNGSATVPTAAGSYTVVGTINDINNQGSATGTLIISSRAITVTADAKSKVYGASDPALTYQVTSGSLAGGDSFSGSLTRIAGTNVGIYAINQGSLSAGSNYSLTYVGANLTITKADATVTLGSLAQTYDGTAKAATATTTPAGLTVGFTYNGSATVPTAAGSYTVVGTINDINNQGSATGTLIISSRAITVTADAKSKVYGASDPALTYQVTSGSLAGGDSFSGSLTRIAGTNVGIYAINQGSLSAGSNYSLTYVGANLTIDPATLTVTADDKSKTQGTVNPPLTISYIGFTNGDTFASLTTQPSASTTATIDSSVGIYPITVSGGVSGNYSFNYVAGTLTINEIIKQGQTITFNPLSSRTYGDADFAPGASASSNLTVTYASSNSSVATIIAGQIHIVGAGTTTITASQAGDATYNPATDVIQSLTVNKAAQTISFTSSLLTKTYGNADFSSIATTPSLLAVTYESSNAAVASVLPASGLVHIVGSGAASITANLAGDANFEPASAQFSLTVDKSTLTVSAANASRAYGAANPTFTPVYSGFVNGESATVLTGAPELSTTADINSPVGSYDITASVGTLTAANYNFSFGSGTLAVDLASQTITFDPLTAKTYGDASFDLAAIGGASGNPVTYTSSNEAVATVSGASVIIVGAGTTTITASQAGNSNYASATAQQNLVVDKKVLNVTAQNVSRPFNTDNPTFTAVYNGFVAGESATAPYLTGAPDFTTTATKTSPVGSYDITASIGTMAAANYTITLGIGTLGIDLASQNITFDPLAAKTYGDTTFNLAATGGDSGNPVTFTSSNEAVATVSGATVTIVGAGTTTITANQTGNSNYASATTQQNLVVNKAPLTVTAQPLSRDYGTDNPTLVPAFIGFVYGDTTSALEGAPVLATSAVIDSSAGSYPITVAAGNLFSNNYTFTFSPGTLTVSQVSQAITITAPAPTTATINSQFTVAAIAPGGTVSYSSGSTGVCTNIGDTFTMIAASGTCIVQYDQSGSSNYLPATQVTNIVTAGKVSQTIGAISFTPSALAVGGTTTAGATATSGLAVSFSSTTPAVCTVSGTTVSGISAGSCTIIASQAGDASYNAAPDVTQSLSVTSTDATLTVTTVGSGNGTVNSNPGGITCASGSSSGCSATFSTSVSLLATADWKSIFTGWSGACTGTGACDVTMDASKSVTATFNVKPLVMMPGPTYFATIQEAYNSAANGSVIQLRDQTFTEDLVFDRSISVTLDGGKDAMWIPAGYTSVSGLLSIVNGSVTIGSLIIH